MSQPVNPRDQLGLFHTWWLLFAAAVCLAPLAPHLSPWAPFATLGLLAWRAWLVWQHRPLPHKWLLTPITLGTAGATLLSYGTLFGRLAGVSLFAMLVALKLMETRSRRDAVLVVLLCYFLIITQFLFGQGMLSALAMAVQLTIVTAALHGLHSVTPVTWRIRLKTAGVLVAQGLPVMVLLFLLFPRIQGPLWRLPDDKSAAATGLSDTMSPGNIAELSQSADIAFRVTFDSGRPMQSQLYWRGPVLWHFDGRTWHQGWLSNKLPPPHPATQVGAEYNYTVTLEPHRRDWLFAMDLPTRLPDDARLNADYQMLNKGLVAELKRYTVRSATRYRLAATSTEIKRGLQLPANFNPQSIAFAQKLREQHPQPAAAVQAVLRHFNQEQFFYTLQPPILGRDSVDDFLFGSRRGFCEHYAGAFVFLMRAMQIPARVVTGYQGGEYNPVGNYFIIRQSDAHAWAEVWLQDQGWVRVDPTASVARERIEQSLAAALPQSDLLPFTLRGQPEVLRMLRYGLDSMVNRWNQWVVGYDTQRQANLLRQFGIEDMLSARMVGSWLIGGALAGLPVLLWLWLRGRPPRPSPVIGAWQLFRLRLAKLGIHSPPHEGPSHLIERAAATLPQFADAIHDIGRLYLHLRYLSEPDQQRTRELIAKVRQFPPR
ncbi:transglutaminase-like putative cysteine protease [Chitinivorax tropicus]|uniref:Transglutaminase-like putative cysteine protease n=1 Tax=Chitinivorax tropicus TaxID=714531 RepID=A0A840MM93_9PROT|nr:DUF3488 and transglutaminase-like domain-containing protein [Chitinivorax tropicus]MBB5017832.1 transglutaminase-like putative cysteine protease [Chitinivorax tropicus]